MNTDEHGLRHSQLTQRIIGVFYQVYNELGYGFLESVYVEALADALRQSKLRVDRELPLAVSISGKNRWEVPSRPGRRWYSPGGSKGPIASQVDPSCPGS